MNAREEFDMLNDMKKQIGWDLCQPLHSRMDDLLEILYPGDTQTLTGPAGVAVAFGLKRVK